jgi:iron complex transport system ATP-binding protein
MRRADLSRTASTFRKGVGPVILKTINLDCGYTTVPNVVGATFALKTGEFLCLLGPNGSGKTALLKTLAGILPVRGGSFEIDGVNMLGAPAAKRASLLAYVPQSHAPVFPFAVRDVVVMGRAGRWPLWAGPEKPDWEAADEALETTGMADFALRPYSAISGGERQMVMIARALAQGSDFLLLDEPASSLDFGNQQRMLRLLTKLAASGKGIVMASHNPEHALRSANRIATIRNRTLECLGAPEACITARLLHELYNINFLVCRVRDGSREIPVCVPGY